MAKKVNRLLANSLIQEYLKDKKKGFTKKHPIFQLTPEDKSEWRGDCYVIVLSGTVAFVYSKTENKWYMPRGKRKYPALFNYFHPMCSVTVIEFNEMFLKFPKVRVVGGALSRTSEEFDMDKFSPPEEKVSEALYFNILRSSKDSHLYVVDGVYFACKERLVGKHMRVGKVYEWKDGKWVYNKIKIFRNRAPKIEHTRDEKYFYVQPNVDFVGKTVKARLGYTTVEDRVYYARFRYNSTNYLYLLDEKQEVWYTAPLDKLTILGIVDGEDQAETTQRLYSPRRESDVGLTARTSPLLDAEGASTSTGGE